jgi:hypothetical protein
MQLARPAFAPDPRQFGRRSSEGAQTPIEERALGEDLKLFGMTFAAGFLFVSILIG